MAAQVVLGRRYVALGDSYTIGTSVEPADSWPARLTAVLARGADPGPLLLVANLGINGATSGELIRDQLPMLDGWRPEFATLLIGVNDVVRGVAADTYDANLGTIFDALLDRLAADRVVTVAIPDYTVTPSGADYGDPRQQSRQIKAFNAIMAKRSNERWVRHVDTFDLSLRAARDRTLVAPDGTLSAAGGTVSKDGVKPAN